MLFILGLKRKKKKKVPFLIMVMPVREGVYGEFLYLVNFVVNLKLLKKKNVSPTQITLTVDIFGRTFILL